MRKVPLSNEGKVLIVAFIVLMISNIPPLYSLYSLNRINNYYFNSIILWGAIVNIPILLGILYLYRGLQYKSALRNINSLAVIVGTLSLSPIQYSYVFFRADYVFFRAEYDFAILAVAMLLVLSATIALLSRLFIDDEIDRLLAYQSEKIMMGVIYLGVLFLLFIVTGNDLFQFIKFVLLLLITPVALFIILLYGPPRDVWNLRFSQLEFWQNGIKDAKYCIMCGQTLQIRPKNGLKYCPKCKLPNGWYLWFHKI